MAGITRLARIIVPLNVVVLFSQASGIVVFVAVNTTERLEIAGCGMALGTLVPLSLVFTAENWEIGLVVLGKGGGLPSGVGGVAEDTISRKTRRLVVRVSSCLVVILVASKAIVRCIRKITADVALGTVVYQVTSCQREKGMAKTTGS